MPNPMMGSLYKSADMEEDLPITWESKDGFRHMRAHFGVVFHAQSNDPDTKCIFALMIVFLRKPSPEIDIGHTVKLQTN